MLKNLQKTLQKVWQGTLKVIVNQNHVKNIQLTQKSFIVVIIKDPRFVPIENGFLTKGKNLSWTTTPIHDAPHTESEKLRQASEISNWSRKFRVDVNRISFHARNITTNEFSNVFPLQWGSSFTKENGKIWCISLGFYWTEKASGYPAERMRQLLNTNVFQLPVLTPHQTCDLFHIKQPL